MSNDINVSPMQSELSFLDLIKTKKILVPKIQRDYAQGRLDRKATEIRDGFLSAIIETLTSSNHKPLLLDFIYGSTHYNTVFTPLDGQQRLTTLFLLHWYLIPKKELHLLTIEDENSLYSRFSYETRISSKDFCNALVTYSIYDLKSELNTQLVNIEKEIEENKKIIQEISNKSIQDKKESDKDDIEKIEIEIKQFQILIKNKYLSNAIINQPWFLWSWRKDPTVKAILVMLDELDLRLGNRNEEQRELLWEQLVKGKIIFHLLPLEQFYLTDELYVKMNARGKELSSFDIFKSTLEEQMRLNKVVESIQNTWVENVDSNWIDLFWNKLAKPFLTEATEIDEQKKCVDSVEDGYLRFLKRMMEFHLFVNDNCFECNWNDENIKRYVPFEVDENTILNELRDFAVRYDILLLMPLFCKTKFFNADFFDFIINSFESLIYKIDDVKYDGTVMVKGVNFEKENTSIFESFISEKIDYETRVQFFAVIKYFKYNNAISVNDDANLNSEFNSWMRIIRNISTQSNTSYYNKYDDFLKSIKAIEKWAIEVYGQNVYSSINDYFVKQDNLDGFNREQLKEEKTKAELINKSSDWKKVIRLAEEHKYFLGQIRFLLEWSFTEGDYQLEAFKEYHFKLDSVFVENGLTNDLYVGNNLFRNAMMTISDWYLLNNCFMQNTSKDRDWSWKRYLRESSKSINIKILLDKWDKSKEFKIFCSEYINENKPNDWRKFFIEKPEIYNELLDDKISWWNWENKEISLLSKTRWSSKHKELYTYYLHLKYIKQEDIYLDSTNEMNRFSAVFKRKDNKEFSIKFIPKWDDVDKWIKGKYVISSNYNPQISEMQQNRDNSRWEQYFDSNKYEEVEELIKKLNSSS